MGGADGVPPGHPTGLTKERVNEAPGRGCWQEAEGRVTNGVGGWGGGMAVLQQWAQLCCCSHPSSVGWRCHRSACGRGSSSAHGDVPTALGHPNVGTSQCGDIPMWGHPDVGTSRCGDIPDPLSLTVTPCCWDGSTPRWKCGLGIRVGNEVIRMGTGFVWKGHVL